MIRPRLMRDAHLARAANGRKVRIGDHHLTKMLTHRCENQPSLGGNCRS